MTDARQKAHSDQRLMTGEQGFSLLEVLIAVGLLAVMMAMLGQAMVGILGSKDNIEESAEFYQTVYSGLNRMWDDFNMAFLASETFYGPESAYLTGFKGEGDLANFSTMSHIHYIKNQQDTDQVHVGYSLRKNDAGHEDLVRRETDYLVGDLEKGGKSFVLIPNVSSFELEYYDSNKKDWEKKWDTTSVSSAGRLPRLVKIRFSALGRFKRGEEDEREEHEFELIVPVMMYREKITF